MEVAISASESVVIGGSHPNGASAVNPLSYIMVRAYMKLDITHPHIYCRIPKNPPKEYIDLLADYVINGDNRAQLLCDESIIKALVNNGITETDAVDYYCGGCMEVGVQGRTSDFLFTGYHNIPKLLELCMTGAPFTPIKENLRLLSSLGAKIVLRCPLVPNVNTRAEHFEGIARIACEINNLLEVNVMAYHLLGNGKYDAIGMENKMKGEPAMTDEQKKECIAAIAEKITEISGKNVKVC